MNDEQRFETAKCAPVHPTDDGRVFCAGITMREYTAIAAMQGLLANPDCNLGPADIAVAARQHADALLKELAKTEKDDSELTTF